MRQDAIVRQVKQMVGLAGLLWVAGCGKAPQTGPVQRAERAEPAVLSSAALVLEHEGIAPGQQTYLGVMIELAPGWHTYADPPGDSGMAPVLKLELPEGVTAGPLEYPAAQTFTDEAGTTRGFEGRVLLRVPVRVEANANLADPVRVAARLDYLICNEVCVPRQAGLTSEWRVQGQPSPPTATWSRALAEGGWNDE